MKRTVTWLTVIMLAATTAAASDLSLFGSYWDTDDLDDTWGVGLRVRFASRTAAWLEFRGTYLEDVTDDAGARDLEVEAVPADVGLGLSLLSEESFDLYLAAGGTYYLMDGKRDDIDDEIGWYGGAGGELWLSEHVGLFGEFIYRDVEATVENDDPDDIDDRVDIDLSGSVVNVGIIIQ